MSILKKLTPINLLEEKEKFFADEKYNPQFKYEENITDEILNKYGQPNSQTIDLAQTIINQAYYQKTETELRELRGPRVNQKEVEDRIIKFLDMHGLKERFELIWSSSFVARATITNNTIKLRSPIDFRQLGLLSMIYHEIGTHALRRINYEQQPWFQKKKEYKFKNYLQAEEGLAALHSLLPQNFQLAYQPALNYMAVKYAQEHSFAELWQFLTPYIDNLDRRWIFAFRKKRGLTNTSQPGGFTKDLLYFEGMIKVWQYLKKHNFDITNLYFGKMALEDIDKAVKMNPDYKPLLPSFYVTDPDNYKQKMISIGKNNFLI